MQISFGYLLFLDKISEHRLSGISTRNGGREEGKEEARPLEPRGDGGSRSSGPCYVGSRSRARGRVDTHEREKRREKGKRKKGLGGRKRSTL